MKSLIISADYLIGSLFEDQRYYVDISLIDSLETYLKKEVREDSHFKKYQTIVFDVDYNSILRAILYRKNVFDLVGERIYRKGNVTVIHEDSYLQRMIKNFIEEN